MLNTHYYNQENGSAWLLAAYTAAYRELWSHHNIISQGRRVWSCSKTGEEGVVSVCDARYASSVLSFFFLSSFFFLLSLLPPVR